MDKMLSVHSKNANKQLKTKKRPVKVVHISNPMKFNTSASEFRALVQELTGQDSVITDPSKYSDTVGRCSVDFINECDKKSEVKKGFYPAGHGGKVVIEDHHEVEVVTLKDSPVHKVEIVYPNNSNETTTTDNSDLSFEEYAGAGEDFVPELLENFPGFVTTHMWYD